MSDLNLLRYYARLAPLGVGNEIKTALSDVAETLFTSPRHARNLLGEMQKQQWLSWQPKVGRNQRSSLMLQLDLDELKAQLATKRIQQGKYEKALAILDNNERAFGQLLQSTSGASIREGRLHIQLTYKRPFEKLLPHSLHRSSERYLIRQVYCCLVTSNRHGMLEGQLAHHWQHNEHGTEWSFYLRPGLTFHNGNAIGACHIAELFQKLKQHTNYQQELNHLIEVQAPMVNKVTFYLSEPDFGFGGLLSGIKYSIQPLNQLQPEFQGAVTGSGVFEVVEHSETKLCMQAFDRYYACRALTDMVTIWQLDERELKQKQIETNHPEKQREQACHYYLTSETQAADSQAIQQTRIEDGCMFVLFNQRSGDGLNEQQRRYFSSLVTPETVYQHLQHRGKNFGSEHAYNLLPIWHKVIRPDTPICALPKQISIAVYDYNALVNCATAVADQLNQLGIQVKVNTYSYRELNSLCAEQRLQETMVLTNINLDDNRHASAFNNLFHNAILHGSISAEAETWLIQSLKTLRQTTPLNQYLNALEPIAAALINQYWLLPLFHHSQTLRFHGVLKDVALTNWGWPDIRNVWSAD
ncbi:SgrR family transcriptional regulator [Vibrio scophthalmi]|uniref:HTH-type transcriptional regulator SgrR n=1 Tax=Vibrio scophthalmi TaxID=45658 RepID=A0A1C7FFS7_9VIBR|nr:SgrR family transcriptional regulator [Vibrio scophthalmi]ANU38925.1 HTH-type transcriptional regulator SgrR [Vibrio scophthalmi]